MLNYMNTLNLSVDNALTAQQIIHQLITKMNELVDRVNNLNIDFLNDAKNYTDSEFSKINSKLNKEISNITEELAKLDLKITSEVNTCLLNSREYTDIKVKDLHEDIKTLNTRIDATLEDSKAYTDGQINLLDRQIELLNLRLEELARNSFSSVSMLDGAVKNNTDCFYDLLRVMQRGHTPTLDQIIDWFTFSIPSNSPFDAEIVPSSIDDMLHNANSEYWNSDTWHPVNNIPSTATGDSIQSNLKIPPTWGNITSIGLSALGSLNRKAITPSTGAEKWTFAYQTLYMAYTGTVAPSGAFYSYNIMGTLPENFEFKKLG